jgi:hypothetical protein
VGGAAARPTPGTECPSGRTLKAFHKNHKYSE